MYERASTYISSKTPVNHAIPDSTEVVIVGSSITSLTLAVDLARRGVGFILLKTNTTRSPNVDITTVLEDEVSVSNTCGENFGVFGLQPRSLEVYEDLGVVEAIMAKATPLRGERMIIDGHVALDWNYDTSTNASNYKLPVTIEQCEVERILLDRLVELGCSDKIKGPIEVMDVVDQGPKVYCRYRAVMPVTDVFLNPLETPHSTPSQMHTFDALPTTDQFISGKFLVGCDGTNSYVRRHLGIGYPGCAVNTARFVIADVVMDWGISPDTDKVTMLFANGYVTMAMHLKGNVWRLTIISHNAALASHAKPEDVQSAQSTRSGATSSIRSPETPPMRPGQLAGDDTSSVSGSVSSRSSSFWQHAASTTSDDDEEVPPPSLEDITYMVQCVVPDATCTELLWTSWTPIISRCCPTFSRGRSFLAGDAAHVIPPLFLQGLNTGIQDSHNLGWKLAQVIHGAPVSLLDTYSIERQPINLHLRYFVTLPGRQLAEGGVGGQMLLWVFKNLLPSALDVKSINQAVTRKTSQLAIQYNRGALVGSRRVSSGVGSGQRCPDAFLTRLRDTGLSFTRLHQILMGPHHTLMVMLHLPTLSDTLATIRANVGKKRVSDSRLMELLLDDVMSFMAEMTKLLRPKSRQPCGGLRNVMILTSGKPMATPQLPAVTGSEASEEIIAECLSNPAKHTAVFTSYITERYLSETKDVAPVVPNEDFFLGWDSECELTDQVNWGLSPKPQASLQSVMHTLGSWTKGENIQALQDGTADSRDVLDAVISRFGNKYGRWAMIRPDGHVSHSSFLSDLEARREATEFTRQYLCSEQAI